VIVETKPVETILPKPYRCPTTESFTHLRSDAGASIVANSDFAVAAGEVVGIIGPSGFGKMSLLRKLVTAWTPEMIGPDVRFLSQAVGLMDGTIAENIAGMPVASDDGAVIRAARAAGAHEALMHLPNGYATRVGQSRAILSAGQCQQVALAKTLYGDPSLIVLDEFNADFDAEGETATLLQAIRHTKARGVTVVLIVHRIGMLPACDRILALLDRACVRPTPGNVAGIALKSP
jgi:ATP-binding cassette, subfamily C, type I secretion system permease/ATPase